jgi:hypothetical protein
MKGSLGGQSVRAGFYWNPAEWEIVAVDGRSGGVLPGGSERRYFRVPVLLMLALAPVMGGLFVVFLPLIGFTLLIQQGVKLALRGARSAGPAAGRVLHLRKRPAADAADTWRKAS